MIQKDFAQKLLQWYSRHKRDLPWRKTKDPYRIWISEVMLQQTTVAAVIPYYERWFRLFPDIPALNRASLQTILKAWEGLGYYQRARNLKKAAEQIMEHHDGKVPEDYQELIRLPGFGPYITGAVLSITLDLPYPVIDANVKRILMRLMRLNKEVSAVKEKSLRDYLEPLLPSKQMGNFNQALMEMGALVCRPKNPSCLICPVTEHCRALVSGEQEVIPVPKKRRYKKARAVIGIIKEDGKYLIQKRPPVGLLADLWEFPGGKIKTNETERQALQREIKEELNAEIQNPVFLTRVKHSYTQFQVSLFAYECHLKERLKLPKQGYRWVTLQGMRRFPFPSGSIRIIRFLEEKEKESGEKSGSFSATPFDPAGEDNHTK